METGTMMENKIRKESPKKGKKGKRSKQRKGGREK